MAPGLRMAGRSLVGLGSRYLVTKRCPTNLYELNTTAASPAADTREPAIGVPHETRLPNEETIMREVVIFKRRALVKWTLPPSRTSVWGFW